jgi:hypothetical protein
MAEPYSASSLSFTHIWRNTLRYYAPPDLRYIDCLTLHLPA